ncbi:MAG: CinA family nicotinamide mononucleotide deamidase-related protein [Bdellovibrionales bacterium]|nr:CinA family nicotinamide mononucleotide deamidase-related protein [Bdellovibrionales bacterium]
MNPKAAILSIGGEILDGRIQDTNANRFIRALNTIDIPVVNILSCPDDIIQINDSLRFLFLNCDIVLTCGGLGPTTDDLTREAVAEFTGGNLELNSTAENALSAYFERKQRRFDETNRKQAYIPSGSQLINNEIGSAPGFSINHNGKLIVSLPGVPRELSLMLKDSVLPLLLSLYPDKQPLHSEILRLFGLPEAAVGGIIERASLKPSTKVSYRATFPEIQLRLLSSSSAEVQEAAKIAAREIGEEYVFSRSLDESFPAVLHRLAVESGSTIAVAESCTGGMLGSLLTQNSGSSAFFHGGVISYSNELKQILLGVKNKTLSQFGAVSHQTAREMARGARTNARTAIGVSISGIAGPDGGSEEKPVGTFYVGHSTEAETVSYRFFFSGEREAIRRFAAFAAMDTMRRHLLSLPIHAKEQENED